MPLQSFCMCKSNKMFRLTILILCLAGVLAAPKSSQKIIGGTITTIAAYPYGASLLYSWNLFFYSQACGGTLLTTRSILSAAHCFYGDKPSQWRVRLGSTFANRGGSVYCLSGITIHKNYNANTLDFDVALLKTDKTITYVTGMIQPASIAGANYNLGDNQPVFAIGWGLNSTQGGKSVELRHVQVWTVNQAVCRSRYAEVHLNITDNMLCSGWLDVGGRDQCSGDSGGPLIHNNVIVGICSWGKQCALPRYPGVNTRVSKFVQWIVSNA